MSANALEKYLNQKDERMKKHTEVPYYLVGPFANTTGFIVQESFVREKDLRSRSGALFDSLLNSIGRRGGLRPDLFLISLYPNG